MYLKTTPPNEDGVYWVLGGNPNLGDPPGWHIAELRNGNLRVLASGDSVDFVFMAWRGPIKPPLHPTDVLTRFKRTNGLVPALIRDIRLLSEDKPYRDCAQHVRRALIRAFVAAIEAFINTARDMALAVEMSGAPFPDDVKAALYATHVTVQKKGKIRVEPARWSGYVENLQLAYRLFNLIRETDFEPAYKDNGWARLQATLRVRHRITHPRYTADFEIADSECEDLDRAIGWFLKNTLWDDSSRPIDPSKPLPTGDTEVDANNPTAG